MAQNSENFLGGYRNQKKGEKLKTGREVSVLCRGELISDELTANTGELKRRLFMVSVEIHNVVQCIFCDNMV